MQLVSKARLSPLAEPPSPTSLRISILPLTSYLHLFLESTKVMNGALLNVLYTEELFARED